MTAPEPRRCVAPIEILGDYAIVRDPRVGHGGDPTLEELANAQVLRTVGSLREVLEASASRSEFPVGIREDGTRYSVADCAPDLDDLNLCGCPATEERTVDGLVMPLCAEHARELDEERAADARELAAIAEEARAAGFTGHLPPGDLSEWCLELKAAGLDRLADRVRETEAYRNS